MLVIMVLYFLQYNYKQDKGSTPLHLLLMQFFRFYGEQLFTKKYGISIRKGGFLFLKGDMMLGKEGRLDGKLAVESPIDALDDVAAGARNYG